jgi:hypothetical protein
MPDRSPLIPFVPRNTNQCLDLAVRYVGQFLPVVSGMWLLIALPSAGAVYALAVWEQMDLRLALVVIYFATLPLGVLVMNDAVPRIFGYSLKDQSQADRSRSGTFGISVVLVLLGLGWAFLAENLGDSLDLSVQARSWSIWGGLGLAGFVVSLAALVSVARFQRIDWGTGRMFFLCLCLRSLCAIGPAMVIFPPFSDWRLALVLLAAILTGVWLALRTGFLMERTCLSRLDPRLQNEFVSALFKQETGELFGRASWMAQYSLMMWAVLFVSLDAASSLFFRTPIFLGRLAGLPPGAEAEVYLKEAWELLARDPLVLAALTATALLVYPINRLAWFFCYIDIRVRKDCWDLELRLANKTRELSAVQAAEKTERSLPINDFS